MKTKLKDSKIQKKKKKKTVEILNLQTVRNIFLNVNYKIINKNKNKIKKSTYQVYDGYQTNIKGDFKIIKH